MRVLLTGATELIGTHILDCLMARGDTIRLLVLPEMIDRVRYRNSMEVIAGSLDDPQAVAEATKDVEVVYHAAQLLPAPGKKPEDFEQVNLRGTENLLQASVGRIRRFVFISSVLVYRPTPWPSRWPITEDSPRQAHGNELLRNYGQNKIDAEDLIVRFHHNHGLEYVILRPTVAYAPGAEFVEQLLRQIVNRPRLALYQGAQLGVMQWVHVSDLAETVVLAGTRQSAANEVFNVAGSEAITVEDVATMVWDNMRLAAQLPLRQSRISPRGNHNPKFDTSKVQAVLGYTPQMKIGEGLEKILAVMQHRGLLVTQTTL